MALVGATASGKSALALELARRLGGIEIVSVDSMQVYRRMDIGTAKPSRDEQSEIPHHLVDLADPSDDFTLTRFQESARAVLSEIESRGNTALLVGGTALYLRSVIDDLEIPPRFPEVRTALESQGNDETLFAQLQSLDPLAASRMNPTNRRRIIRALEVTLGGGKPFSSYGVGLDSHRPSPFRVFGIWLPRELIKQRIARRFANQMSQGFLEEVRGLSLSGMSRTARQALGYSELLSHVENGVSLEHAIDEAIRRTQRFSRRQLAWFRRDSRITWFATGNNSLSLLPVLLEDLRICLTYR